jgi:hypothetical protein
MAAAVEDAKLGASTSADDEEPRSNVSNLFVIVPSEDTLVALRHLRAVLAPEYAVVGVLSGRLGQRLDPASSVEERATTILDSIVRIQDRGPYFLAAASFGGLDKRWLGLAFWEPGPRLP